MQRPITVPRARSMLLRVWDEPSDQPPYHAPRLSVESVNGQRREFESPEALASHLRAVIDHMDIEVHAEVTYAPLSNVASDT
jgi:hypothetical protein